MDIKIIQNNRLKRSFYIRDVLEVAPELPGKILAVKKNNKIERYLLTEVEAYRGEEDLACHACKGKTKRNAVMYEQGGLIYVYLIYGMYWMLNFVTGKKNEPQAVLIRGIEGFNGPGKLTKHLLIDNSYYGEDLIISDRIWVEEGIKNNYKIKSLPRIGIDYAGDYWKNIPWRFAISEYLK